MQRILIGNIKGPQGAQGIQGPQGPVGATGPQGPMPDLVNNALATEAGVAALDAVMGKTLQDQITQLNSKTHELKHGSFTGTTDSNGNIYPQFEQNIHSISSIAVDRIAIPFLDGSGKTDFHIMNYDGTPATSLETTAYYWYFDA